MLIKIKKYLRLVAFCTFALLTALPLLQVFAATQAEIQSQIDAKQAELADINRQLEEKSAQKEAAQAKADTAYARLMEVSEQLRIEENKVNALISRINKTQELIEIREESIRVTQAELDKQVRIYSKRLRDIYKNGQINYIDVLFGSKDFSDFATRLELLKRVVKHDIGLINKIKEQRELLVVQKQELEADKKGLQKAKADLEPRRQAVLAKRNEKAELFEAALADRERADQEYNELLAMSEEITALIRRFQSGGQSGSGTGRMIWPVQGEITSEYGWRTHPVFGDARYHSGLDIGVDYDVPVAAADSGVVIHAGWLGGYGYAVILDHGGGIQTLYGHNNSVNVSEGQNVVQGATIAYAGSTGYSTGPHVHFEVRVNGEPTNPYDYLP